MGLYLGLLVATLLAGHGYNRRSLSPTGAAAAFTVGLGTMYNDWNVFAVLLLMFYFTGSRLTKFKGEKKKELEEEYLDGGQRTATQVYSNALWGTLIAILHQYKFGGNLECLFQNPFSTKLFLLYLGHYATCNGDTWASEIGVLSKSWPILITTFERVPPGTNGGVSPLGLAASLFGGLVIGGSAMLTIALEGSCDRIMWELVFVAGAAGLIGSLVDSLLGATIQRTVYNEKTGKIAHRYTRKGIKVISGWDILDNNQVNFVASFVTSCLTAFITMNVIGIL